MSDTAHKGNYGQCLAMMTAHGVDRIDARVALRESRARGFYTVLSGSGRTGWSVARSGENFIIMQERCW